MNNLNSKKWIIAILALILSFALVVLGKLTGDTWIGFVSGLITGYTGANLARGAQGGQQP